MPAQKRLLRNVRAAKYADDPNRDELSDVSATLEDASSDEESGRHREGGAEQSSDMNDEQVQQDDQGEDDSPGEDVQHNISHVSFGALKHAQDAYSRKRKRGSDETQDNEQKLAALRSRLDQIRAQKNGQSEWKRSQTDRHSHDERVASGRRRQTEASKGSDSEDDRDSNSDSDSDSDSAPSEEGAPAHARSSKHAPTAQSSKRQVTRKRTVIEVPKRIVRDPRFDALSRTARHSDDHAEKAYGFIREYQKSEIAELQGALRRTKNEEEKETLRRKMVSMQNRIKAKEDTERRQAVIRQHRKEEREKVAQGKTPFYLKKKDVKEAALVEKFKSMKGKDREKLMDRRRKKESQKEKKRMPALRR